MNENEQVAHVKERTCMNISLKGVKINENE